MQVVFKRLNPPIYRAPTGEPHDLVPQTHIGWPLDRSMHVYPSSRAGWWQQPSNQARFVRHDDVVPIEAADAWFTSQIAADPQNPEWRELRAAVRLELGDHAGADEDFNALISLMPELDARLLRVSYYEHRRDWERALEELDQIVYKFPQSKAALSARAKLRVEHVPAERKAAGQELRAVEPDFADLIEFSSLVHHGTESEIEAFLAEHGDEPPGAMSSRLAEYAMTLHLRGQTDAALQVIARAEQSLPSADIPEDPRIVQALGTTRREMQRRHLLQLRSMIEPNSGSKLAAMAALASHSQADPMAIQTQGLAAMMQAEAGDKHGAIAKAQEAFAAGLEDLHLRAQITEWLLDVEDWEGARAAVDYCLEHAPGHYHVAEAQYRLALHDKDYAGAAAALERHLESHPDSIFHLNELSRMRAQQGDHAAAVAVLTKAIAIDPTELALYINRGLGYRRLKQGALALADFNHVLAVDPQQSLAWTNRAVIYSMAGDFAQAIADIEAALAIDSQRPIALNNRAYYRIVGPPALRDLERARADVQQAMALAPDLTDFSSTLAALQAAEGDFAEALRSIQRAIDGGATPEDRAEFIEQRRCYERGECWHPRVELTL